MERQEPNTPPNVGAAEDALRRLEERLARASEAAERLIAEAAGSARAAASSGAAPAWAPEGGAESGSDDSGADEAGADEAAAADARRPPPAGWQTPLADEGRRRNGELELLIQFFQSVRDLIPPDLQRRLGEALRELLLAIRALIDWYLERNEQRRTGGSEVQDIPIL
jgi:hypothetical protein